MSIDDKRKAAAAGFVMLLALSVTWPSPVVAVNELCCHASLAVDELSFLGREAPSWDVVFWAIAGLYLIAMLQAFSGAAMTRRDLAATFARWRRPATSWTRVMTAAALATAALFVTWRYLDATVTALAERADSPQVEDVIRIFNRLGGGLNPALVVLFFLVAGAASRERNWVREGVAMAVAAAAAGIAAQIIKFAIARVRPEIWVGPFVHAQRGATSFPSGHTIGAFALAGVLLFASRSLPLRVVAMLLAIAVGLSRILAFRHWATDVLASALLGLFAAWLAVNSLPIDRDAIES